MPPSPPRGPPAPPRPLPSAPPPSPPPPPSSAASSSAAAKEPRRRFQTAAAGRTGPTRISCASAQKLSPALRATCADHSPNDRVTASAASLPVPRACADHSPNDRVSAGVTRISHTRLNYCQCRAHQWQTSESGAPVVSASAPHPKVGGGVGESPAAPRACASDETLTSGYKAHSPRCLSESVPALTHMDT